MNISKFKKIFLLLCFCLLGSVTISIMVEQSIVVEAATANGWKQNATNGNWYYYKNGTKVTSWQIIDGKKYYFHQTAGILQTGWKHLPIEAGSEEKAWYYLSEDEKTLGQMTTGWKELPNSKTKPNWDDTGWYFFNATGRLRTGWLNYTDKKTGVTRTYYLSKDTYLGKMYTGLQTIGNNTYYFYESGEMVSGKWLIVNKKTYYLASDGKAANGWKELPINNTELNKKNNKKDYISDKFYFKDYVLVKGLQTINNKKYYFNSNSGRMETNMIRINDNDYFFDDNTGEMLYGWIENRNYTYYANSTGKLLTGLQKINNTYYYFYNDEKLANFGAMVQSDWVTINNKQYYFRASGSMNTGWYYSIYCSEDPDTLGQQLYGLQFIDGHYYYFDKENKGQYVIYWKKVNNNWYYFQPKDYPHALDGWQVLPENNNTTTTATFYFKNCIRVSGFNKIDSYTYYFDSNGRLKSNCFINVNDNIYYADPDGHIQINCSIIKDDVKYTFDENGILIDSEKVPEVEPDPGLDPDPVDPIPEKPVLKFGWFTTDKGWMYRKANAELAKSEYIDGYWLNSNGLWTYKHKASWKHNAKGWWYEDTNGWYAKNQWLKINNKWYYFNTTGYMKTGWLYLKNKWYYLDSKNGFMLANTSLNIDGKIYKFNTDGICINP